MAITDKHEKVIWLWAEIEHLRAKLAEVNQLNKRLLSENADLKGSLRGSLTQPPKFKLAQLENQMVQ